MYTLGCRGMGRGGRSTFLRVKGKEGIYAGGERTWLKGIEGAGGRVFMVGNYPKKGQDQTEDNRFGR